MQSISETSTETSNNGEVKTAEPSALTVNIGEASRTYGILFEPGDIVEFRCLSIERGGRSSSNYIQAGRFPECKPFHDWMNAHHHEGVGLYYGPNPRKKSYGSGGGGAGTDDDVLLFRSVFADFDDATPDQALDRIETAGLAAPTLLVASGRWNGCHAYWRFDEPITDPVLWKGLQRGIIKAVGSDPAIKNPSRIMRLPGSHNFKRDGACVIVEGGTRNV